MVGIDFLITLPLEPFRDPSLEVALQFRKGYGTKTCVGCESSETFSSIPE
jgi:hypothetical protein